MRRLERELCGPRKQPVIRPFVTVFDHRRLEILDVLRANEYLDTEVKEDYLLEERKYEVIGTDPNNNIWTVATDQEETAKLVAASFRKEKYTDVHIVEH